MDNQADGVEQAEKAEKKRRPMTFRRQVKRLVILLAGAYVLLMIIACGFADRLMFHPHESSYADTDDIIKLTTADGVKISAMYFANPAAKFTILHSHGNAEDMGDLIGIYREISNAGFNVLAYDYNGYGTSEGTPGEKAAYADIDAAYDYLTGELHVPPERIIVLGRSIGGGPAVDLAARRPVGGLVLESAFVSAFRTVTRVPLLPWDKFENLKKLPSVKCPVLVIHGDRDSLVAPWHGKRLYEAAPGEKQCLWVEGAGHNDLVWVAGERYARALQDFAALVEKENANLTTEVTGPARRSP